MESKKVVGEQSSKAFHVIGKIQLDEFDIEKIRMQKKNLSEMNVQKNKELSDNMG